MHNQSNRDLWHNCQRNKRNNDTQTPPKCESEGPCIIGGESPDNRFSTQQGKTEQKIRKEEIRNLQNNRKKDNTKFCILLYLYLR